MKPLEVYDKYSREWSDISLHLPWLRDNAHGTVLEIGVREGISTAALLLGVAHWGGHVYSVDIEDRSELYSDNPDYAHMWTFIQADSKDWKRVFEGIGLRDGSFSIDLLFIDGCHSYSGCISDLTTYGPWSKVIAVHDTNSEFQGVWEATIAYFRSTQPTQPQFKRAEFRNESNGLGILSK